MIKLKSSFVTRTLALALVCALAGFTYATSTQYGAADARSVAAVRAVGSSGLRFTNALLIDNPDPAADTFDLGDAYIGSTVTRYITAFGGVRPYAYASANLSAELGPDSSLAVLRSGMVTGIPTTGTTQPLDFTVTVTDSTTNRSLIPDVPGAGNTLGGVFRLNLLTPPTPSVFRFAVSALNNGVLGVSYASKLDAFGGALPVRYTVVPGTVAVNGNLIGTEGGLEAIGLSLAEDGTVFGKPLVTGNVTFTARGTDADGLLALDRATGTTPDQQITFSITDNGIIATDMALTAMTIKGTNAKLSTDTIKFSAHVNLGAIAVTELNGSPFALRVGGASYEGRMNERGQAVNRRGGPLIFADGSQLNATINAKSGLLTGTLTRGSLSRALNAENIVNRTTKRLAVGIFIGSGVVASETVDFVATRSRDKYQLEFRAGKTGQTLGGTFHLISVGGRDGLTTAGNDGIAWNVKFYAAPRFGVDPTAGTDAIDLVTVRIGTGFQQSFLGSVLTNKNGKLSVKAPQASGESLRAFDYDTRKFTGSIQTLPLTELTTGLKPASGFVPPPPPTVGVNRPDPRLKAQRFSMTLVLDRNGSNADFRGDAGKLVSPIVNRRQHVDNYNLLK